ncbi:MAG: glycosyltransferase [Gammaproteobacteria bacterium]|nr:glycosyltransferase [Gammaproteobacteria bacterium]
MKFALIITNLAGGGAEKAILKLANALLKRSHTVHLILFEEIIEYNIPKGVILHTLRKGSKGAPKGVLGKLFLAKKLKKVYGNLDNHHNFDVTISTLPFTDEIVYRANIHNVWHRIADALSIEIDELRNLGRVKKAQRRLRRYQKIYRGKQLIVVSEGLSEEILNRLGVQDATIRVIHNIYPFESIRNSGMQENPNIPDEPYIIHVGRFSTQKRHDLLFHAFSNMESPHKLVLLTQQSDQLNALIEDHNLSQKVIIPGFQKNPYNWIKQADLLVLCSDHEGLPNVLVEALILQTRVISTDCPSGPKEILGNLGEKYLVECNNAEALLQAMNQALNEPFREPDNFRNKFSSEANIIKYEQLANQT